MTMSGTGHYTAAGGVVVREGRVLILDRPSRDEVRLPKGHVEPGETLQAAALRETREESGLSDLRVLADLGTQHVEFEYERRSISRDERYFLLGTSGDAAQVEHEAQFAPRWLSWPEALEVLSFAAEREWVRRARMAWSSSADRDGLAVCLSTGSLYTYGLERTFGIASELGFDGMEVLIDHRWDTRQPTYLRSLTDRYAIPIVSLHTPFVSDVQDWPPDEVGRLRRTVLLAQELGVSVVVAHLPLRLVRLSVGLDGAGRRRSIFHMPRVGHGPYDRFLGGELDDLEQRSGVRVCVENMPATRVAGFRVNAFLRNSLRELAGFRHVTLDTTHVATWGRDPLEFYAGLGARVAHVHLSNYDVPSFGQHHPPQHGDMDLSTFVSRLRQDGYDGLVAVEANPATLAASDPAECRARLQRTLAFCRGDGDALVTVR